MQVAATKKMTRVLNSAYSESGYSFTYTEMSRRYYENSVNYRAWLENGADYIPDRDVYRVIRLDYPPEYYALPRFITTADLSKCFRASDGSLSDFLDNLQDEIII